jgi:DNA-binding transcriptional LysR family regulator
MQHDLGCRVIWDDLRYVLAVARAESISGASRQLGVSHSTVYRRLKAFEEERGVLCFERLADGVRLTEAGAALVEPIANVEKSVLAVERSLSQQEEEVSGTVTIAAPEALATTLCAQLGPLLHRHPKLAVHWRIGTETLSLQKGETDIALRVMSAPGESLVGRRVCDLAFAIYASREHVREHPWAGVESARWIVFDDAASQSPQGRWERENVPDEAVVMRVNRRVVFDEAIAAGHGVGITACGLGDQRPAFVRLEEPIKPLTVPLWVLTHETLSQVPRVRVTMDMCADLLMSARDLMAGRQS